MLWFFLFFFVLSFCCFSGFYVFCVLTQTIYEICMHMKQEHGELGHTYMQQLICINIHTHIFVEHIFRLQIRIKERLHRSNKKCVMCKLKYAQNLFYIKLE